MTAIDPEQERQRLTETYFRQGDGELEEIAAQAYQLTEIARAALGVELSRRGLSPPIAEYPAGNEAEMQPMVTIRQFRDLPEALFAKGSLESAAIDCALVDDNMVRLYWFISNLLGGVKL
jgi:hypothetical protein